MLISTMPPEAGAAASGMAQAAAGRSASVVVDQGDGAAFRAELASRVGASGQGSGAPFAGERLAPGEQILQRASDLAGALQGDQQYVSKLLETATRTGDPLHLMKAVAALNDYQTRVQFVSKVVSKTATSIDQLTKLQ